jgi:hypothetical protein
MMVKRLIVITALTVSMLGMLASSGNAQNGVPQQLQAIRQQLQDLQSRSTRRYYMTKGSFDGLGASTACASGFHMANLFEMSDPSNLAYDTTLGFTTDDSGDGPP